jgi:hypothetical protein
VSPRLTSIAAAINAKVKGYKAEARPSWSSTDRKLAGTRLIHPGKGRRGFSLVITNSEGREVFVYDTSVHSYRSNKEAAVRVEGLWGPIWLNGVEPKLLVCWKCKAVENKRTQGRFTSTFEVTGACVCPKCSNHG